MNNNIEEKYDFKTWKEVQESEVQYWQEEVSYLKQCANVDSKIENWQFVKDMIEFNTSSVDVKEEFIYDDNEWIEEILEQVKPYFVNLLNCLEKDNDFDYEDYILNFWNE